MAALLSAPIAATAQTNFLPSETAAKAATQQTLLVDEDFSLMTAGSEAAPDYSFNINTCEGEPAEEDYYTCLKADYTHTPGWGSYMVCPAGGMVCFNNTRADDYYAAHINPPLFDASAENGTFFISFRARLMEQDPNYKGLAYRVLDCSDADNPTWITAKNVEGITAEWKEFTLRVDGGVAKTRVIICEEYGKRVLFDDFKVYQERTAIASPNVLRHLYYNGTSFRARWNKVEGATKYFVNVYKSDASGTIGEQVVDNLESTDTICTVRGIVPGEIYRYNVTASDGVSTSVPSRYVVLNELQSPTLDDVTIEGGKYTARWEKIPNALYYNYYVYADRVAEEDGECVLIDEDFNSITDADGHTGSASSGSTVRQEWTAGNEPEDGFTVQENGYPLGTNMAGFYANDWVPLKAGYPVLDGWFYYGDVKDNISDPDTDDDIKEYAKLETPILNFAADSKVKVKLSLWGEYAQDTEDRPNYPYHQVNAIVALVAFNPATGMYEEVESKHFDLLKNQWQDVECEFGKGYEDAKIVVYATDGPGLLYVDNLKVTQQLKKGDAFASCIVCKPGITNNYVNIDLPEGYDDKTLYHRAIAVNQHKAVFLNREYFYYSGPSEMTEIQAGGSTAIEGATVGSAAKETARYAIDGTLLTAPKKGVNIVRYADGSVRKVVVR